MPKDPVRNVDRYKVRGGHLNEFDFTRQKQLMHKYSEAVPEGKKRKPRETRGSRGKNR
jgi:hypothetical protein